MRYLLIAFIVLSLAASPATAHCGKPHPEGKGKTETSRPLPKPE